jgi:colanic acid/amylovoran biosynthesis glycosyltransferase
MELFLFSNFFPYKRSEPFLINEFEITGNYAEKIHLFTLYGSKSDALIIDNTKVTLYHPVLTSPDKKRYFFVKGTLNKSSIFFHLKELLNKKLFLSKSKLYWFFVSCLVTRTILASQAYKQLIAAVSIAVNPVLYFYWGDNFCWLAPYLKKKLAHKNIRIVIRLHGTDLYEFLKAGYSPIRNDIFRAADLIVPISENGKLYLENKYPEFSQKYFLSRLGVFDHGLNPESAETTKHVISVSNIVKIKRLHLIYEALQNINDNIVWHHFGDGILADEIKSLTSQPRAGLRIVFHGHVENKNLMHFYRTQPLSALLNTSSTEGLPVSVMEALSFGVPVIATDVGGTSELVSSETGVLLPAQFATEQLVEAVTSILHANETTLGTYRLNARKCFLEKVNAETNYRLFYQKLKEL